MECTHVRPLLYRFVENQLLPDDATAVQDHLSGCEACLVRARQIVAIDEAVLNAEEEWPSPRLRQKLLADYRRLMTRKTSEHPSWAVRFAGLRRVAAVALIVFGSSTTTWFAVHSHYRILSTEVPSERARVSLDHVFPLVISHPYTIVHQNGQRESGTRTHIIQ